MTRGTSSSWRTSRALLVGVIVPRALPAPIASDASTASWQVKALVEATPISGPARIGRTDVGFARYGRFRAR